MQKTQMLNNNPDIKFKKKLHKTIKICRQTYISKREETNKKT